MNVALQAFVLLMLFLPGALCVAGYMGKMTQKEEVPSFNASLGTRTAIALIAAMLLHLLWLGGAASIHSIFKWPRWSPNPEIILDLFEPGSGSPPVGTGGSRLSPIDGLSENLLPNFFYFFTLYLGSWGIGVRLREFLRNRLWDRRYPSFRYTNHWHYALSGEAYHFRYHAIYKRGQPIKTPIVAMQALVQIGSASFIYCGLVHRWHHNPADGQLDWVQLEYAARTVLDDGHCVRIESLPNGLLYIKFSEIQNFILRYYEMDIKDGRSTPTEWGNLLKSWRKQRRDTKQRLSDMISPTPSKSAAPARRRSAARRPQVPWYRP